MLLSDKDAIRRAGIYFFYDKDGVVDDYNIYLLQDIRKNLDHLLVVVNGYANEEGQLKFRSVCDEILIRENIGFDVWAYKEGMAHYGWEALAAYDELVMLNFTNFGPVYPFSEMFHEMNERDLDFWGVVMRYGFPHDPYKLCKYGYIPDHISTSFMVVRNSLLTSKDFIDYWDNMPMINSYDESVCYHEAIFTEDFKRKGYKCGNYINAEDLKEYWDYPLMLYPLELVKNRRCPIFKRKTFYNIYEEFFIACNGEPAMEFYEYLRRETNYDVNLIWDNLLRTVNMWDLKERMQLNYILPSDISYQEHTNKRIALMLHIYFEDRIDYCLNYAHSMPEHSDIYITTDTEAKKALIEQKFSSVKCNRLVVSVIQNRGRDVSALLVALRPYVYEYDYVCFAHDKKVLQLKPYMIGEGFAYKCFENLLGTKEFVNNVIHTFEDNPRLGMLVPPPPIHSEYNRTIGFEWGLNFDNTVKLARELGIKVDMNRHRPPVAPLGTMFWFRPKALSILFERKFEYSDFPSEPIKGVDGTILHTIERLYPFAAQEKGYYTAWLCSSIFAKMEITNLYYCLRDIHTTFYWHYGIHNRQTMLYLIGHPYSEKNNGEFVGHGITKESPDSNEKNPNIQNEHVLSTWILMKLLARQLLPARLYDFLVTVRNWLRRR